MKEEKFNYILMLICFIGAIGIVYPLNPLVFWDQCIYILHAKYFAGFEVGYNELGFRSPLISLLTSPIAYFQGSTIPYKIFGICWSLLFPLASLLVVKDLFNTQKEKLLFMALITLNGLLQYEAKFFLTDIPSLVLLLFSFYFLQKNSPSSPIIAGVLCGLGILMRLGNISLLPIFFFALVIKKDLRFLSKFGISFILTLLPYQLWVYKHHGSLYYNFQQARIEGMRNATFSFSKLYQLFNIFGVFSLVFSITGIYLTKNFKLAAIIIFSLLIIPYNQENSRFLLVLLPLIYFSVMLCYQKFNFRWKKLISIILLLEVFIINYKWRQKFEFIRPGMKSYAEKVSDHILKKFDHIPYIASSFIYPDLAYFTGKKLIPLAKTAAGPDGFKYVDRSALKDRNVLVLVNDKTIPKLNYFVDNKFFKSYGSYEGIHFFEYLGGLKKGYKQYSTVRLINHFYWGYYSKGFLEINMQGNASQFLFVYKVSDQFIKENNLTDCGLGEELKIDNMDGLKVVSKTNDELTVDIKPNTLGRCKNSKNISFRVRYGLITEFD